VPLIGLAASSAERFETPLGTVLVDRTAVKAALELDQVRTNDEAHRLEHCLEVQLPFLQVVLQEFEIVPLLVGRAPARQVSEVLDRLWGGDDTLIVISSDLSHYFDYDYARERDEQTSRAILEFELVGGDDACGAAAINGLLDVVRTRGLTGKLIDLRSSADTAGGHDRVVGYGAFLFGS
jgi:AmmeMemoRadiSam system protein B